MKIPHALLRVQCTSFLVGIADNKIEAIKYNFTYARLPLSPAAIRSAPAAIRSAKPAGGQRRARPTRAGARRARRGRAGGTATRTAPPNGQWRRPLFGEEEAEKRPLFNWCAQRTQSPTQKVEPTHRRTLRWSARTSRSSSYSPSSSSLPFAS